MPEIAASGVGQYPVEASKTEVGRFDPLRPLVIVLTLVVMVLLMVLIVVCSFGTTRRLPGRGKF